MHFGVINGLRMPLGAGPTTNVVSPSAATYANIVRPTYPATAPTNTVAALPTPGECDADGQLIWKLASDGTGYWARRSASETCTSYYAGVTTNTTVMPGRDPLDWNFGPFKAGPFSLPASPVQASYTRYLRLDGSVQLPKLVADYLHALLQIPPPKVQFPTLAQQNLPPDLDVKGSLWNFAGWCNQPITKASYQAWMSALKFGASDQLYLDWISPWVVADCFPSGAGVNDMLSKLVSGWYYTPPVYGFKHPDTGQPWGIWLQLVTDGENTPYRLEIIVSTVDHWKSFQQSGTWLDDLVNDVIKLFEELFNLTCGALTQMQPGASGNPYITAAQLGATFVCGGVPAQASPLVAPPPVLAPPPWWQNPLVLLAGGIGAMLFVILLSKKSKGQPT